MREISLRDFQIQGPNALESVPEGESVLLIGRDGPLYFLIPVLEEVTIQALELRRAMAKASLLTNWRLAELSEESLSPDEIDREIDQARVSQGLGKFR